MLHSMQRQRGKTAAPRYFLNRYAAVAIPV